MGILPHIQGSIDSLLTTVITDRLRNCQDMRFVERAVKRRAAVSAGAESNQLRAIAYIGLAVEVLFIQARHIDQHFLGRRFSREWRERGARLFF